MPMTEEQRASIAEMVVRTIFRSFDNDLLEEMIAIGRQAEAESSGPPSQQVLEMNAALALELERRRAEA